jgi:hypothetical protein
LGYRGGRPQHPDRADARRSVVGRYSRRYPSLAAGGRRGIRPHPAPDYWAQPTVVDEPDAEEGPVLVILEYRIDPENSQEFDRAIQKLGRIRRRDGASRWGIFHDVADPGRRLETFLVESWSEHMRQHARFTEADCATEDAVRAFHLGGGTTRGFPLCRRPSAGWLVRENRPCKRSCCS